MILEKKSKVVIFSILFLLLFFGGETASAATFNLSLKSNSFKIGDIFDVGIKIDSAGATINTAQATLKFSADVLDIESVDKAGSVFTFWLTDPTISNSDGTLIFTAGSGSGFSGPSLQVLNVKFKAKGNGTANITFNDAAITLSDGTGTNVLSDAKGTTITVSPTGSVSTSTNILTPVLTPPVQITRVATPASGAPIKPVLEVPLYSDQTKWYNVSSIFSASWTLPTDVTDVATSIDKDPRGVPTKSEGLFDNKSFAAIDAGVWYLHVRFGNNIGWGPTNSYKISVDSAPPVPFEIKVSEGTTTDNPTPTLTFSSGDPLSGLDHYAVKLDNEDYINTIKDTYTFTPIAPGNHLIRVDAVDKAGNITESVVNLKILPIEAPKIFSVTREVFIGEGGISINGSSLPSITLLLSAKNTNNDVIYSATTSSDVSGNWVAKLDQPLKRGTYFIEVTAKDARGALSYPVNSDRISVKNRPIMVIFGLEITSAYFAVLLAIILVFGFAAGLYFNKLGKIRRGNRSLISERDIAASFGIIKKDVDKALEAWRDNDVKENEIVEIEFLLKRINENLEKMQKYVIKGVRDINK